MAEQLNILGLWERTTPGEEPPVLPPAPLPPPPPVDPRQEDLLAGAHTLRSKIEDACVALEAGTVRALHAELIASCGTQRWSDQVPAWADAVAWLVEPLAGDELATRALSFQGERMPGVLSGLVRGAALRRAAQRLIEERGAAAALPDGRPAGYLALLAGDFALSRTMLTAALENERDHRSPRAESRGLSLNPQWLGYLGEASWRLGDRFAALHAYCAASVIDPSRIDAEAITCEPVLELQDVSDDLELSDVPHAWLAVLADLLGWHALEDLPPHETPTTPQRLAAMLREYRRARPVESARIEAKRAMARLAPPGLRELLRRL